MMPNIMQRNIKNFAAKSATLLLRHTNVGAVQHFCELRQASVSASRQALGLGY